MFSALKSKFLAGVAGVAMALGMAVVAPSADAAIILVFGQTGTSNTVTATAGASSTTISGTNIGIVITAIEGGPVALAYLDFTMTSTDAAFCAPICTSTSDILQHFSGSFSINSLANNTGIDYLSGTFVDSLLGHGGGIVLTATTPPSSNVVFSVGAGSTITTLGGDRAISLSFSNVNPAIDGTKPCGNPGTPTVCSFTSSISGNMSAGIPRQTPEPGTVALLGLALAGLGFSRRTRK